MAARLRLKLRRVFIMGKAFKILAAAGAVAAGTAAVLALKKRKELEDYDYEELDDDFDDCVSDCEDCAEEAKDAAEEVAEDAAEAVEDAAEEVAEKAEEVADAIED